MSEPAVRISQGFLEPKHYNIIAAKLIEGRLILGPALRSLSGLIHYYMSIESISNSMVNVNIGTLQAAQQINTLQEMLPQRDIFSR